MVVGLVCLAPCEPPTHPLSNGVAWFPASHHPTNIASVHLVTRRPNARAGVEIEKKKEPSERPRATQMSTPSLVHASGVAVGVDLVVPMLVGRAFN